MKKKENPFCCGRTWKHRDSFLKEKQLGYNYGFTIFSHSIQATHGEQCTIIILIMVSQHIPTIIITMIKLLWIGVLSGGRCVCFSQSAQQQQQLNENRFSLANVPPRAESTSLQSALSQTEDRGVPKKSVEFWKFCFFRCGIEKNTKSFIAILWEK